MAPVFILTLVLVVALLVALFVYDSRRAKDQQGEEQAADATAPSPTPLPPRERPGPTVSRDPPSRDHPAVDPEQLATHVRQLRGAIEADLVSVEEAADSVIRQSGSRLSHEAAVRLLEEPEVASDADPPGGTETASSASSTSAVAEPPEVGPHPDDPDDDGEEGPPRPSV